MGMMAANYMYAISLCMHTLATYSFIGFNNEFLQAKIRSLTDGSWYLHVHVTVPNV